MKKLNKLFTEEISGVKVLVSYDYETQTFKVVDKESGDILKEGDEIPVCEFLEVNGARIYAPRFMANYPVTKVNGNAADLHHMTPFSLLEFLRLRKDSTELELVIYPRDMQEGAKLLPGIKIPLGECLLESLDKASMINLMITYKEDLNKLKKVAVRTYKECDEREVALVTNDGKYYPMMITPEDTESFKNSLVLILRSNDVDLDKDSLEKALMTPNTLSVISPEQLDINEEDTITECFSVDDLINSQIVVFESSDLNSLSRTLFHVHPEATARKWKVSEIKESASHKGFFFEVQGKNTDKLLSDKLILESLLSENVYITHSTPLHDSSPMDKAVFAVMNGIDIKEAINSMVEEQTKLNQEEQHLKECGSICGLGDVAVVTSVAPAPVVSTAAVTCGSDNVGMTSADIHGIAGKILYPPLKAEKKKKEKDVVKVNDDLKNKVLTEMGIADVYNQIMNLQKYDVEIKNTLTEDDDIGDTSDFNLGSNIGSSDSNGLSGIMDLNTSDNTASSDAPTLGEAEPSLGGAESEENKSEEDKPEEGDVTLVIGDNPENPEEVACLDDEGTLVYEPMDNLVITTSDKHSDESDS